MPGGLILLIVGAAASVGAPALAIWLWIRRNRATASARNHHDSDGPGGTLLDALLDSPGDAADPAQEGANLVLDAPPTEPDEKSILNGNSDFARSAPGAVRAGEAVVPAALVGIAMEADRDSSGEHGQVTPAMAVSTEVACVADGGAHAALREAAMPALSSADMTDTELSADPGLVLAEAPVPPAIGPQKIAPSEAEARSARPSEEAQPQEFAHLNELPGPDACGAPAPEGDDTIEIAETAGGAECGTANSALRIGECAVPVALPGDDVELAPEPAIADVLPDSIIDDTADEAANASELARTRLRPSRPARHRDRRGQRRALPARAAVAPEQPPAVEASLRPPAEAKLRLMLHPIRRTATLSAVLARPPGYPDRVTLLLGEGAEVSSYSEDRYDDVDLEWTADLLSGEVRLDCEEGYQWLRSSRRIHIFGEVAEEPGVISVGSTALSSPSTIICRREDEGVVRAAAEACSSPTLISHDRWSGIPDGWKVLSGYRPAHAAASGLSTGLTGLDPGVGSEIRLSGGLRVRSASFAEGSPPRIEIAPFPSGAIVTIDGQPAELGEDGAWSADGWDRPGDHLVDVVPGPSAAYRVIEDPWAKDGWEAWDAHPQRFGASPHAPWAVAQVCGAAVLGPGGEYVVAADAMPSVVCLGLRRGAVALRGRPDAPVAVSLLREPPAFLISASGPRRSQGRIVWLNPSASSASTRTIDAQWVAAVRSAASRRLPLDGGGSSAEDAWRRARERARRQRRPRT
jgi:hypothetical protein